MIEVLTHPNGLNLISSLLMSNNNILQKLEVNGEVTTW